MSDISCQNSDCIHNKQGWCEEDEIEISFAGVCMTSWFKDEDEDEE